MEDKKTKMKDGIKKFATDYAPAITCAVASYAVGVLAGNKIYKTGFNDGRDRLACVIYAASQNGGGILLTNKEVGDHIFKATKVLND